MTEEQRPEETTYLATSKKTNVSLRDVGMSLHILLHGGFLKSTKRTPSSSLNTVIKTALLFTIPRNIFFASSPQPSLYVKKNKELLKRSKTVKQSIKKISKEVSTEAHEQKSVQYFIYALIW